MLREVGGSNPPPGARIGEGLNMTAVALAERSPLDRRCLLLNADYRPLATFPPSIRPVRQIIEQFTRDKVSIVEDWGVGLVRSARFSVPVPKVAALRHYAPIYGGPKFCRRNILLRDRFKCCYCGQRFESNDLSYDHVIPRSKGGTTTWENIVTCCLDCNARKGNSMPNYSGRKGVAGSLRPLKEPRRPSAVDLLRAGVEFWPADMIADFSGMSYWGVELLP